jgi:hypothetical protein
MMKIFAKHGTTEKALVVCPREQIGNIQLSLNEKFGGNWVLVDKLKPQSEILKFDDGLTYLGFHGRKERYSNAIESL